MRVQDGAHPNTHEWVFDDFSGGSCLILPESAMQERAPRCSLLVTDFETGPGGELVRRDGRATISLRQSDTGFPPAVATLRLVRFERLAAQPIWAIITPSGLFSFNPLYSGPNMEPVYTDGGAHVFAEPNVNARRADFDILNGKLYIATQNNYLVEWDGANPAKLISQDWPEGYQKPSVVRRHAGRLLASGFMDTPDSRACSQIRASKPADASELEDLYEEMRTGDDDMPTALASWMVSDLADASRAALVVFKRNSTSIALGVQWGTYSDISFRTLSTIVGCTGPAAWCHGAGGLYFHDETGIYVMSGPTQIPKEASLPISTAWAGRRTLTSKSFPRIIRQGDEWASLCYDSKRRTLWCFLPMDGR